MRIQNGNLALDGTDMQSNIESKPLWLAHIIHYSVQTVYTGTPNGTLKIQGSNDDGVGTNDPKKVDANIQNWTDLGVSDTITAAGSTMFNVENCGYKWVRLVWTDSSSGIGSTISSCRFNVKGA